MAIQGTILIASKDGELLAATQEIGNALGATVVPADTGACALDFFHSGKVRVTVVDEVLSDGAGVELLKRIRHVNPDAKAIFVTGSPTEALEREVRRVGVHYFGSKPVNAALFRKVLEKVFEHETRRLMQAAETP